MKTPPRPGAAALTLPLRLNGARQPTLVILCGRFVDTPEAGLLVRRPGGWFSIDAAEDAASGRQLLGQITRANLAEIEDWFAAQVGGAK